MKATLVVLTCMLIFWSNGIAGLDRLPIVHQDEAWIVAPGYTFWTSGTFGTGLFTGFYGMESHYLQFMPLFSLIVGGWLHIAGLGLFQARFVPILLTLLTLALTYRLGYCLFGNRWVGALATMVLSLWQIATAQHYFPTGIPLADFARIARYDALVPLFVLAALILALGRAHMGLAIEHGEVVVSRVHISERWRGAGVGYLIGLATLCHITGAFALPAMILVNGRCWRRTLSVCLGFALALLPWALFAAAHWGDFLGQERIVGSRFDVFNPDFYWQNVLHERDRYRVILDALPNSLGANFGVIFVVVGLIVLLVRARRERAARVLLITLVVVCGLFALILEPKTYAYTALILPFGALVTALCVVHAWRFHFARPVVALAVTLAVIEGTASMAHMQEVASQTTSYRAFTEQIAQRLPPNNRLLALQHYWFGLADHTTEYRSFLLPFWLSNPNMVDRPISFADSVRQIAPDVVVVDEVMLYFLTEARDPAHPYHEVAQELSDLMARWNLIDLFSDPSYGRLMILRRLPTAASRPGRAVTRQHQAFGTLNRSRGQAHPSRQQQSCLLVVRRWLASDNDGRGQPIESDRRG